MNIDFHGQVVLVTGATRGIGKQMADDFAQCGARLLLTCTGKDRAEALNKKAKQNKETHKKYFSVNFLDDESLTAFLDEITAYKKIDVCVNNAGINRINSIDETRVEDWKEILAVNLEAPYRITRVVGNIMKKNKYGRIVNISSVFGVISKEKRSLYSMSKFGLRGLTVASALDLAPYHVLVNAVSPGFVNTELTRRVLGKPGMKEMAKQVPLRRLAKPEEISRVALFLCSRLNTYITAQNIVVDGGFVNV